MDVVSPPDVIRRFVTRIDAKVHLSDLELKDALEIFEIYECWAPYFRLLNQRTSDPKTRNLEDYIRMARVHSLYLEDIFTASEICANMVKEFSLSYLAICQEILPHVITQEDFTAESIVLSSVANHLKEKADQIKCLERLCILYEKKTHNEAHLGRTYERLIETDPQNIKALRYFKLVFTQSSEWDEVVAILRTLLTCVTHPQEVYRVALELAAIYLYQLDQASEAIAVLDAHCAESPIDTSTILYDAYHRLSKWEGCLRVLRQCLLSVDDDVGRAVIRFKMAVIHELISDYDEALENYQRSFKLWPNLVDAAEGVINISIQKKDWGTVQTYLNLLLETVRDDGLKMQISQVLRRLSDGLSHVRA